ncbi:antiviral reverse transcriptase Drt3a [Roseiconus lacunae]|uniref:antiviral reverse transcriptase Drt3a n=1 Tax=Roseiconus lacunae TaxID=2605694 RepID=UPI0028F3F9E5|nr:antiviral reverse transcriptase Drt3a [Roseiconus lacunae]
MIAAEFGQGTYSPSEVLQLHSHKGTRVQPSNLADTLLLRHCSRKLRHRRGRPLGSRALITDQLLSVLRADVPHSVFRTDVHRFYQSIRPKQPLIQSAIASSLTADELLWCMEIFESTPAGLNELPQGLSISAELSEFVMSDFDISMSRLPNCVYYARFVDDIVVVTAGTSTDLSGTDFRDLLPEGLKLSPKKTELVHWKDGRSRKIEVTYLGYTFRLRNRIRAGKDTNVLVTMAEKKIRKYEQRIAEALSAYLNEGDFSLLRDRIKYLTAGTSFHSQLRHRQRTTGISANYPLINNHRCLKRLDAFLGSSIRQTCDEAGTRLLTSHQIRSLRKFSFTASHKHGIRNRFSGDRLKQIIEAFSRA